MIGAGQQGKLLALPGRIIPSREDGIETTTICFIVKGVSGAIAGRVGGVSLLCAQKPSVTE